MTPIAPFTYDIFISYGQIDDEDPGGDLKGWVDLLTERLPRVISGHLGYKPKIWRDEQSLQGNDVLGRAIVEGVSRSLILVQIFSPRYVQSDWCQLELKTFCANTLPSGAPSYRSRIFKVIKTPLLFKHLAQKEPEQLRDLRGYSFYEMDGNMPREFSPDIKPIKDQKYWNALQRLAWDIATMLWTLKHQAETPQPDVKSLGTLRDEHTALARAANGSSAATKFVYLAETTSDLVSEHESVRDELRQRGYGVLPEQKLPLESQKKLEEVVRADLQRSVLSVHLVGTRYGSTPEDNPRSLVCLQEELAAQRQAADAGFERLLWMPPGLQAMEVTDERQKSFVNELKKGIAAGTELLQTSVEDLKSRINEKLSPPAKTIPRKLKQVYLICENRDRAGVRPIREYLFKQELEVITWLDGAGDKLVDYHRKNLKECDAALVYFGNGDEPWVRKNLEDLEKAYGYGREVNWLANAVYIGAPPNDEKTDFLTHKVPFVIRNFSSFDPNDLRDFVNAVQAADGGQQ